MAMKVVVRSDGRALWPRDPYSAEIIANMLRDKDAMAEVRQPRSLKQHRFLMVWLNRIADNHPVYDSVDRLLTELKVRAGMFSPAIVTDTADASKTRVVYIVESLSFETMDQARFSQIFEKFRRIIKEEILPGVSDEGLMNEVMECL